MTKKEIKRFLDNTIANFEALRTELHYTDDKYLYRFIDNDLGHEVERLGVQLEKLRDS